MRKVRFNRIKENRPLSCIAWKLTPVKHNIFDITAQKSGFYIDAAKTIMNNICVLQY